MHTFTISSTGFLCSTMTNNWAMKWRAIWAPEFFTLWFMSASEHFLLAKSKKRMMDFRKAEKEYGKAVGYKG